MPIHARTKEHEAHNRACVTQEALYGVGEALLLLVDHVAYEHLERLHGYVDRQVEEHQCECSEDECAGHGEVEASGIGKQCHDDYGEYCAKQEVGKTATEAIPCAVAECAHDGLNYQACQRRQNPKVT